MTSPTRRRNPLPRDVQEFLEGYPDDQDNPLLNDNLAFYQNELRCRPDGKLVEELQNDWFGDYTTLEYQHGFIQWLFPIREHGVNYQSQPLQRHELEAMKTSAVIMKRVMDSYKLMLDFYGMRLIDETTGLLDRSSPPRDYTTRYRNLIRSPHNNLRISRILKCLSELGLEHLNAGFLLHVLVEQSEHGDLNTSMLMSSMDRWWANCIRNDQEREWIGTRIQQARRGEIVFTRDMYMEALQRRQGGQGLSLADE